MLCLNDDPTRVFMRYVWSDHAIECHGMFEEANPTIFGVASCRDVHMNVCEWMRSMMILKRDAGA
jgi:hypothetical protein